MFRRLRRIAQFRYAMRQLEDNAETSDVAAALRWLRKNSQAETVVCEMAESGYEDVQGEGYRGFVTDFLDWLMANWQTLLPFILALFAKSLSSEHKSAEAVKFTSGECCSGETPAPKAKKRK